MHPATCVFAMLLNKARLENYMDKYGIDAIVGTTHLNVAYMTDLDCWFYRTFKDYMFSPGGPARLAQSVSVVARDRDPALVMSSLTAPFASTAWVKDARYYGAGLASFDFSSYQREPSSGEADSELLRLHDAYTSKKSGNNALEVLAATIKDLGLEKGVIGLDFEGLDDHDRDYLKRSFPGAKIANCSELLRIVRMVKSDDELERLTRCAEINEVACREALNNAINGRKAGEALQRFKEYVVSKGALPEHHIYSRQGRGVSEDAEYRFRRGEAVFFDFGCIHRMYYSDTGNTVLIGTAPENHVKIYKTSSRALSEALKRVAPGAKASDLGEAMIRYLTSNGIRNCAAHGHGIGLEARDYPAILPSLKQTVADGFASVGADFLLEENMVLNLEVPYYLFGAASCIVERTVRVTASGYAELTRQEREDPIVT